MRGHLERAVRSRKCYLYIAIGTGVAIILARWSHSKAFLPIFMTLVIYPIYAMDLTQGRRDLAIYHVSFWMFVSSVWVILFVQADASQMAKIVFRGIAYRDEMFRWLLTGEGPEGDFRLFFPEHMKHLGIFCVSAFLTAGVWALAFGAILINYMNFYVGSLLLHAHHPLIVMLFGWPIWSLARGFGFILIGIALSEPLLSQLFRFRFNIRRSFCFFAYGFVFIVIDIFLKIVLATFWRELLRSAVSF